MPASGVHNIGWYTEYSSGWFAHSGPGSATGSTAGSGSSGRLADTAALGTDIGALGAGITDAIAQNVHIFMQALYQALSNHDSTTAQSADTPQQPASSRSQAYQQTQKGLQGRIESLISALKGQGGSSSSMSSSAPSGASLSGLQAAFNRLLRDLGANSFGPLSALNALSSRGSDLTLHSWLQGLQTSLQQGTAQLSSIGNLVDVVV
jgi:hypothetical protein